MMRSSFTLILGITVFSLTAGCGGDSAPASAELRPYRDDWREVVNQPFTVFDAEGSAQITALKIGDRGGNNFSNRGDIIVRYADTPNIVVEMRKFTMSDSEDLAQGDFDRLSLWASTGAQRDDGSIEEDEACIDPQGAAEWPSGCTITVFYDGQVQVNTSGADFRVTLPSEYIFRLDIETEDNDLNSDYQNRSNVCVENLPGSVNVSLENGTAYTILDPDAIEMPECSDAGFAACVDAGWDSTMCPCLLSEGTSFSQTRIQSQDASAADAWVDIPANFWTSFAMRNEGDGLSPNGGDSPGELCVANVDASVGTIQYEDGVDPTQTPYNVTGSINYPGEPATAGAGYNVTMVSAQCLNILGTEDPAAFAGRNNGSDQEASERGNLNLCSGCLRTQTCEELIPSA